MDSVRVRVEGSGEVHFSVVMRVVLATAWVSHPGGGFWPTVQSMALHRTRIRSVCHAYRGQATEKLEQPERQKT
jgi:hypothetical protein